MQSVAGFASLHTAITLLVALMVQYTVRNRYLRTAVWANFVITVIATLYFGWHYIADDIGGVVIAVLAVWLGGIATGQKFDRWGRSVRPTTSTSSVPVQDDDSDEHDRDPGRGSGRGPGRETSGQPGTASGGSSTSEVTAGVPHP